MRKTAPKKVKKVYETYTQPRKKSTVGVGVRGTAAVPKKIGRPKKEIADIEVPQEEEYNPFGKYATLIRDQAIEKSFVRIDAYKEITSGVALDGLRQTVFSDRYAMRAEDGSIIETFPEQMNLRVARAIASVEKTPELRLLWEKKFFDTMKDFKFVPAGRILSGAGAGALVSYYNCFVIPSPEDSRTGIIDNLKIMVEIMSRAGGVGVNLSTLRPRGSYIKSVNGHSSGPMAWAELYSVATGDVISQGGTRRGALMIMLDDTHPDIEEFITIKRTEGLIEHANLSVCVSDAFMEAVKNDADWDLLWQGKVMKTIKATDLWDLICKAAWDSAEPGVVFMDRYNTMSNTWYFENIRCVNPCGEQGLSPWSVCNLGSLNLAAFVSDSGEFDYDGLGESSKVAMRFLDNVIDANYYFFKENKDTQLSIRRTGLGTMGLADALIKMKVRYGSEESLRIVEKMYAKIRDASYEESADLAEEKGSFPKYDKDKFQQGKFIQNLPSEIRSKIVKKGIRNGVLLSQAPTGTISLYSGVSSGIEPVYDFAMVRTDRTGTHTIYHPLFEDWKNANSTDTPIPDYFVSASDLTPDEHVRMQALIQQYTDSSISKTVNAPNGYSVENVKRLYTLAYDLGCKGITMFRDGSRTGVLAHIEEKKEEVPMNLPKERPDQLQGITYKMKTPVGTAFITVNSNDKGEIFEVFINIGKVGSDIAADAVALGRLVSLMFQMPATISATEIVERVIEQLKDIGGGGSTGFGENRVRSLADGVAKVLAQHVRIGQERKIEGEVAKDKEYEKDICPKCGQAALVNEEGCAKCYNCGYARC